MCEIEKAFREGYDVGYYKGGGDAHAYGLGCSTHPDVHKKERDKAWIDSDAYFQSKTSFQTKCPICQWPLIPKCKCNPENEDSDSGRIQSSTYS